MIYGPLIVLCIHYITFHSHSVQNCTYPFEFRQRLSSDVYGRGELYITSWNMSDHWLTPPGSDLLVAVCARLLHDYHGPSGLGGNVRGTLAQRALPEQFHKAAVVDNIFLVFVVRYNPVETITNSEIPARSLSRWGRHDIWLEFGGNVCLWECLSGGGYV